MCIVRNSSVFPSLKAGNYVSPGQETPDKDPIHPLIEPILPCIFASTPKTSSSLSSADTNRETGINNEKKGFNKIGTNFKAIPVIYENGKQFLDSIIQVSNGSRLRPGTTRDDSISNLTAETKTEGEPPKPEMEENVDSDDEEEEEEDYQSNWRLEMVLGQTRDLINTNENAEGIWIALWSGEAANGSRLLE